MQGPGRQLLGLQRPRGWPLDATPATLASLKSESPTLVVSDGFCPMKCVDNITWNYWVVQGQGVGVGRFDSAYGDSQILLISVYSGAVVTRPLIIVLIQ